MSALLLAVLLAAAAAQDAPPVSSPATAVADPGVDIARASSADRLRQMLGSHSTGDPLDRAEVIAAIDERHPKLAAVRAAVRAADGARLMARGNLWDAKLKSSTKANVDGYYEYVIHDTSVEWSPGPLEIEAGYRYGAGLGADGRYPDYWGELKTQKGGEVRLEVGVHLLETLWRPPDWTEQRIATQGVTLADAERELTELVVTRDAVAAWSKWVSTGRIFALERALLDIAKRRQDAVEQRISLGDLAQIERVRNLQILAGREAALAEAEGEYLGAREKLALYYRAEGGRPVRADAERLPDRDDAPASAAGFGAQDPVELAMRVHPLLRAANARLSITELDFGMAQQHLLPKLMGTVAGSQDLGSEVTSLAPRVLVIGAKLETPLAFAKDRGKLRATRAKLEKARLDLTWLEEQIVADVRAAVAREEAALEAWRRSAESVRLALELQDAEQRRFDVGDIDLLRLWQVEQSTAKAIRTEVKAWQAYQVAVAELELAVGQRFE